MNSQYPKRQSVLTIALLIFLLTAVLIAGILALHFWAGIPVGHFTRDPTAVLNGAPYIGFLSQIGLLFWSAAAAVNFFVATVLGFSSDTKRIRIFFMASGFLSLILGLDDGFRIHESVFPHFGVPEEIVILAYAIMTVSWLFVFRNIILANERLLLGFSLFFFALSVLLDLVPSQYVPYLALYEDSAKFAGILFWLAFFVKGGIATIIDSLAAN